MKKNNAKRTVVVIALIALMAIPSMFAYFTDTDEATNTFTVGNVDIELNEDWTEEDGKNVVPGKTIAKVPTVENIGANDAYVFAEVVVPKHEGKILFTLNLPDPAKWTLVNTDDATDAVTYRYAYGTADAMTKLAATAETEALFNSVTFNSEFKSGDFTAEKDNLSQDIDVKVTAIQADGLATATAEGVWALRNN